jgi:hypothetical protein
VAIATRTTRKVLKTVEVTEPSFMLELSEAEANTLGALTMRVSGSIVFSPRKHVDSIASALSAAGIRRDSTPEYSLIDDYPGRSSIHFSDYPEE